MTNSQNHIRTAAENEFRRSPALQAEFSSEAAYVAFRCAKDRGVARIFAPTNSYTAHSARGARVDTAAAAREFDSRPALAEEFLSKEAYVAFKAAEARGACRVFSKPAATAAPAARSSVGAAKPPAGTMSSVLDAMAEFKRSGRSYIRTDLVAHVASRTGMSLHDASGAIADTVSQRNPVA